MAWYAEATLPLRMIEYCDVLAVRLSILQIVERSAVIRYISFAMFYGFTFRAQSAATPAPPPVLAAPLAAIANAQ